MVVVVGWGDWRAHFIDSVAVKRVNNRCLSSWISPILSCYHSNLNNSEGWNERKIFVGRYCNPKESGRQDGPIGHADLGTLVFHVISGQANESEKNKLPILGQSHWKREKKKKEKKKKLANLILYQLFCCHRHKNILHHPFVSPRFLDQLPVNGQGAQILQMHKMGSDLTRSGAKRKRVTRNRVKEGKAL